MRNREGYKLSEKADAATLKNLINLLEGYSIARYVELDSMERSVKEGELGTGFVKEWKEIRKDLHEMASTPMRSKSILRLVKIRSIVRAILAIYSIVSFALIIASFLLSAYLASGLFLYIIIFSSLFAMPLAIYSEIFLIRKISSEVEKTYNNSPRCKEISLRLRRLVQDLIYDISGNIRNLGLNPEDYAMELYHDNYKGVKVVKSNGPFRKAFKVIPDIN